MSISGLINDYSSLQTAVSDYLDRSDLGSQVPVFIQLCESEIKRVLRRASVIQTVSITQASNTLSAALSELRSLRLITSSAYQDLPIKVVTPESLAEVRARSGGIAGRPTHAAIVAGAPGATKLLVTPTPDQAYTAELIAYSALVPLSASNTTNDVLLEAPDLYLYGALKAAEPFMEHDERIATWDALFQSALSQLNDKRSREENSASLRPARLPTVF